MGTIIALVFTALQIFAKPGRPPAVSSKKVKQKNCEVRVVSTYHKGGQNVDVHYFKTKTKAECQKISQSYAINLTPGKIKQVEVHMVWRSQS